MNQNNEKNVSKNIPTPTPTGGQEFEEAILGPCPHDHGGHKILTTCGAGRVRVAAIEWMGQSAGEIVPGAYYIGGGIWVIQSGQDKHFSKENIFCHACAAATPTPEAGR